MARFALKQATNSKFQSIKDFCKAYSNLFEINTESIENIAIISKAPQPQDIAWQNTGHSLTSKYRSRALSGFLILSIFGALLGIVSMIMQRQNKVRLDEESVDSAKITRYAVGIAILISFLNEILSILVKKLVKYGKFLTYTAL